MFVVAISASNIRHAREQSTSLNVCRLIGEMVSDLTRQSAQIEILPLVDFELQPCTGCGRCFNTDHCVADTQFNRIYAILKKAEALFIVSPHYAPVPARLCMLLEKIEQLTFLKRFNDETYRSPLFGKPAGIIGHGGGSGDIHYSYQTVVVDSIWNALAYPVEMNVLGGGPDQPRGVTFPVKQVSRRPDSIFPFQVYDFEDIRSRLQPLVHNVMLAAGAVDPPRPNHP